MGKITAAITGVGQYLPDYLLTNDELSRMVDTNDEWITSHTGIKTRHILKGEGLGTSYMGARAIRNLLKKTGIDPMEIDAVICATITPDMFFPSTGNLIADQAGCKNAFAYVQNIRTNIRLLRLNIILTLIKRLVLVDCRIIWKSKQ